eukprot:Clim_evm42s142 gene=Clim_evmTU42s142
MAASKSAGKAKVRQKDRQKLRRKQRLEAQANGIVKGTPNKGEDRDEINDEFVVEKITVPSQLASKATPGFVEDEDPQIFAEIIRAKFAISDEPDIVIGRKRKFDDEEEYDIVDEDVAGYQRGDAGDNVAPMSKTRLKKIVRPSLAELKLKAPRPDLIEAGDVNALDPDFLAQLKGLRHAVAVPPNWSSKRRFLSQQRGQERKAYQLPEYIKATGVQEKRDAAKELESTASAAALSRMKIRPKLGRMALDYQKLYDAFFKWQTRPSLTPHGKIFTGKEDDLHREFSPGQISDRLRVALGMPIGPGSEKIPPPWLISMQRYGPPPAYPGLPIPGLNCPIPEGCYFGYHAGGWGKPPVDQYGNPIYGNVFDRAASGDHSILHYRWGTMDETLEPSEYEEVEQDENEAEQVQAGAQGEKEAELTINRHGDAISAPSEGISSEVNIDQSDSKRLYEVLEKEDGSGTYTGVSKKRKTQKEVAISDDDEDEEALPDLRKHVSDHRAHSAKERLSKLSKEYKL